MSSNEALDAMAAEAGATPDAAPVEYSHSAGLFARLAQLGVSLAFTSYQSGFLYLLGRSVDGGIHVHQTALGQPMGMAVDPDCGPGRRSTLTLCDAGRIIRFENVLEAGEQVNQAFDACYMPRTIHMTGSLSGHDVGLDADGRVLFVNTRYNCLAAVSERYSFEPIWRPPFISGLVDEDRCHLNGLAMEAGQPAYVTAVSRSDTIDGWRDRRASGGVVIDVARNAVICEGLSMPHSPRLHGGELWVLNSGTGELGVVHRPQSTTARPRPGAFEPRVFCPGFVRGLAFHGDLAFVALSKPRYKRFEGLALDQRLAAADSDAWCGIQILDLRKRTCVDWFRIDGAIGELYDVAVLPGFACPMAISPNTPEASTFITHPA